MGAEGTPLSIDEIISAERGRVKHPIIDVLNTYAERIEKVNAEHTKCEFNDEDSFKFLVDGYGFLADAVEGIGDFSLSSKELLAIWAKVMQFSPGSRADSADERYRFATIVATAYSLNRVDRSIWQGTTRSILQTGKFPQDAVSDHAGLTTIAANIKVLDNTLETLRQSSEVGRNILTTKEIEEEKRLMNGDNMPKLIRFSRRLRNRRENTHLVLVEVRENFSYGLLPIRNAVRHPLER